MLINKEICSKIEAAFHPYRCIPEIWDYDQKLRFKVYGAKAELLVTVAEVVLSSIRDPMALESLITSVRDRVEQQNKQRTAL